MTTNRISDQSDGFQIHLCDIDPPAEGKRVFIYDVQVNITPDGLETKYKYTLVDKDTE